MAFYIKQKFWFRTIKSMLARWRLQHQFWIQQYQTSSCDSKNMDCKLDLESSNFHWSNSYKKIIWFSMMKIRFDLMCTWILAYGILFTRVWSNRKAKFIKILKFKIVRYFLFLTQPYSHHLRPSLILHEISRLTDLDRSA